MAGLLKGREKCRVMGRGMFPTKSEAKDALSAYARAKGSNRCFRCIFCDHYHMTKGERGPRKGRGGK